MPLDQEMVENAKAREKPFRLLDERGLFLVMNLSGSKLWQFKYRFAGKDLWLPLGTYPEVTLEIAREKRDEARRLIGEGRSPSHELKAAKLWQRLEGRSSFKAVALDFIGKMDGR